jgi:hypothetical protein
MTRFDSICKQGETIRALYAKIMSSIPPSRYSWLNNATEVLLSRVPSYIVEEFEVVSYQTGCPFIGIAGMSLLDELARLADLGDEVNPVACSSIAAFSSKLEQVVVGRNLDYGFLLPELRAESYRYFHKDHGHGHDYYSWSWPGFLGVATGLNSQGLWLATHTARSTRQSLEGVPNSILYRMILEQASSIADAREIIEANLPACASNVMLASFSDHYAEAIEIDNGGYGFRQTYTSYNGPVTVAACTNHFTKLEGAATSNSRLRQYFLRAEGKELKEASIDAVSDIISDWGVLNEITAYSIVTDGNEVRELIGDGIPSDADRYEASVL